MAKKQREIPLFHLLFFMCFATTGLMEFAASGKQVRPLLVDNGVKFVVSPPQIRNDPNIGAELIVSPPQIRNDPNIGAELIVSPPQIRNDTNIGAELIVSPPQSPKQVGPLSVDIGAKLSVSPPRRRNDLNNYRASNYLMLPPLINLTPTPSKQEKGYSITTWCVVKPSTPMEKLDDIIDFCCTQPNVDCSVIQRGGMCYFPSNKISDASVVMNIFYAVNGKHPFNCYFKGSGMIVTQDPSVGTCIY